MGMVIQTQVMGGAARICGTSTGHLTTRLCLSGPPGEDVGGAHRSPAKRSMG